MSMMPITIFGEVLFDCFPDGRHVLGGAPFNVAWHLHAFGMAPRFISAVGADAEGAAVRQAMDDWGMDRSGVQADADHPTGQVQVRLEAGEPSYEILPDSAFDYIRPPPLDRGGGLFYHGTLALRQPVSAAALDAIKTSEHAIRVLDVNLRDPWWSRAVVLGLVDDADWVKLNRDELYRLQEDRPSAASDPAAAARAFGRRHKLAGVVVTLGAAGALAVSGDQEPVHVAPSPALTIEDTVGAGDAFASVLLLGLAHGWPLQTTLERAQGFASRIVGQRGATAANPELYRPFRDRWGLFPEPTGD